MNVSDYIFDFFNKKGIDTCFCITGGHAMWLNDALARNKNYSVIFTQHEEAATMSSDAYGRIKIKPALSLITAAPAGYNAINGVVGGYTDSSPMIVISGQSQRHFVDYERKTGIRQYGTQGIDIEPSCKNIVKYFQVLDDLKKIKFYLEKAYNEATTGRPGPVWLDVPLDIQSATIDDIEQEEYKPECINFDDVNKKASAIIFDKLKNSNRPLIVAGQGIALSNSRKDFIEFINNVNVPVVTTRLGIDLIETDNNLYVGRPGNYGERSANFAIQNADFILCLGTRLAGPTVGFNSKEWGKDAYKVVVDIDEKELEKPSIDIDYKVKTDCKSLLTTLSQDVLNHALSNFDNWIKKCNYWKTNYPVCQNEYKSNDLINTYYFCDRLSFFASDNANVLVDTGSCFHVACQTWKVKKGQKYLTTGGLSSMGYWCACIGACIANDKKETICLTGDGSLQMNIQEFATIRGYNLPIKIFVFDNDGYLLIRHTQRNFMNERLFGEGPNSGVWLPDIVKVAEAYELKAVRINKTSEIDEKIKEVLDYDCPVICDVKCDPWQLLAPRVTSEKLPDGTLVAHDYADMFPFLSRDEYKNNMITDKQID